MNIIKRTSVLLIAITASFLLSAQDITKLIPKEAVFVGVMNTSAIKTKMDFENALQLPMLIDANEHITKRVKRKFDWPDSSNFLDLRKHGFDLNKKAGFYFVMGEKMNYGALVVTITNRDKFKQFVKMMNKDPEGEKITEKDGFTLAQKYDINVAWNDNKAAFFGSEMNHLFRDSIQRYLEKKYDYDPYYSYRKNDDDDKKKMTSSEFYDIKYAYIDSVKEDWYNNNIPNFIKGWGGKSITNDAKFNSKLNSGSDVAIMLDYGMIYSGIFSQVFGRDRDFMMFMNFLEGFYTGMKLYANGNFEKDDIVLDVDMVYSQELKKMLSKTKKTKISKNYLKYLNKDLMGYYALSLDVEGISEGVKSNLKETLPSIPKYGNIAATSIEILETFLDEKAIYNIFSGEVVFAFNGIKEMQVIYKTYDYDEEFHKIDVIDTTYKELPDILLMVGVGNKKDVEKFLKLGIHSKVLKKEGNLYTVDVKGNKIPVHFTISDDILFVGTNEAFLKNPIAKAKQDQLDKRHKKMFKKNMLAAYANIAEITGYIAGIERNFKDRKVLIESSGVFKTAWISAQKNSDGMNAKYRISLSESEDNSISDILKYFNELFLIYERRM